MMNTISLLHFFVRILWIQLQQWKFPKTQKITSKSEHFILYNPKKETFEFKNQFQAIALCFGFKCDEECSGKHHIGT